MSYIQSRSYWKWTILTLCMMLLHCFYIVYNSKLSIFKLYSDYYYIILEYIVHRVNSYVSTGAHSTHSTDLIFLFICFFFLLHPIFSSQKNIFLFIVSLSFLINCMNSITYIILERVLLLHYNCWIYLYIAITYIQIFECGVCILS